MTVFAFIIVALVVGAVGVAVGIIVAPRLTRMTEGVAADGAGEAPAGGDGRD